MSVSFCFPILLLGVLLLFVEACVYRDVVNMCAVCEYWVKGIPRNFFSVRLF